MESTTRPRPAALDWSTDNCQVERAMAVLGQRSTLLVLREVFNGIRRFDDMQRHSGISRQVLTDRLAVLVEHGVLVRAPYQAPAQRERHEYKLTAKGYDLYPFLAAVATWGARYYADAAGPAVELAHRGCEASIGVELTCEAGHRLLDLREVATRPGPGAHRVAEPGSGSGAGAGT